MAIIENLIPQSQYATKCPFSMTPKGICVHNTANDAPAINERNNVAKAENQKEISFHVAIDDKEAIQLIPFNRNAWASEDGTYGNGNRNYIHIEICYSLSGGTRFDKAEERAVKEIAALCKRYNWGIKDIKKHQDFSNKYCPHRTLDKGWDRFLNMIQKEMNSTTSQKVEEVKKVKGIVIYSNDIDKRAAEYLADYLKLPLIHSGTNFDYSTVERDGIYAVGGGKGTFTGYLTDKNFIYGADRYETVKAVLKKIGKL